MLLGIDENKEVTSVCKTPVMIKSSRCIVVCALAAICVFGVTNAHAVLIDLGPGSFTALAPKITFSEVGYPLGTVDPSYTFAVPSLGGNVTVDFGGHFLGQTAQAGPPALIGSPTNPLTLDPTAPVTFTASDGANPTSPVLSGTPLFGGPVSVLFSTPVAGVGLDGGYFDAIGGTTIEAFDATGASLGTIVNTQLGIEFYGLADSGGANVISGISFHITGSEPFGYVIDNLTFGAAGDIHDLVIPEPLTMLGVFAGISGLGAYIRKRRMA